MHATHAYTYTHVWYTEVILIGQETQNLSPHIHSISNKNQSLQNSQSIENKQYVKQQQSFIIRRIIPSSPPSVSLLLPASLLMFHHFRLFSCFVCFTSWFACLERFGFMQFVEFLFNDLDTSPNVAIAHWISCTNRYWALNRVVGSRLAERGEADSVLSIREGIGLGGGTDGAIVQLIVAVHWKRGGIKGWKHKWVRCIGGSFVRIAFPLRRSFQASFIHFKLLYSFECHISLSTIKSIGVVSFVSTFHIHLYRFS